MEDVTQPRHSSKREFMIRAPPAARFQVLSSLDNRQDGK